MLTWVILFGFMTVIGKFIADSRKSQISSREPLRRTRHGQRRRISHGQHKSIVVDQAVDVLLSRDYIEKVEEKPVTIKANFTNIHTLMDLQTALLEQIDLPEGWLPSAEETEGNWRLVSKFKLAEFNPSDGLLEFNDDLRDVALSDLNWSDNQLQVHFEYVSMN